MKQNENLALSILAFVLSVFAFAIGVICWDAYKQLAG